MRINIMYINKNIITNYILFSGYILYIGKYIFKSIKFDRFIVYNTIINDNYL
jgi:hypothetical protein